MLLRELAALDVPMHSLLVIRHATVVLDFLFFPYDGSRPHDIASCTKSVTSTAVAAALQRGDIANQDVSLLAFFPGRTITNDDSRKRAIMLQHALTMTSGIFCGDGEATTLAMQQSSDWLGFALDLPMHDDPGQVWQYCSIWPHLLAGAVQQATTQTLDSLLTEQVLGPIGITSLVWPSDPQGVAHGEMERSRWSRSPAVSSL